MVRAGVSASGCLFLVYSSRWNQDLGDENDRASTAQIGRHELWSCQDGNGAVRNLQRSCLENSGAHKSLVFDGILSARLRSGHSL